MDKIPVDVKRNVSLLGHHGCGKTHIVDTMLFGAGFVDRTGIFATDTEAVEKEKKASFSTGVVAIPYNDNRINVIDTPGMSDLHSEVTNGIWASENAVLVVNASAGVEIQTERFGALARDMGKNVFIFFNMMDKDRAAFEESLEHLSDLFDRKPVVIQIPVGSESDFRGVIDLISNKIVEYPSGASGKAQTMDIPEDLKEAAETARTTMIENIVETDEGLLERYFEGEEISEEELMSALKKAYKSKQVMPVLFGSAIKNIGVDQLMRYLVEVGITPAEADEIAGTMPSGGEIKVKPLEDEPFAAYIFKSVVDPFVGKTTFMKVISGTLSQGDNFVVVEQESSEKANHIYVPDGTKDMEIKTASVGDIVKMTKMKKSAVGNTATHKDRQLSLKITEWPEPMISRSIQPKSKGDIDKISNGLSKLVESDPTFSWEHDSETGETVIYGLGSIHLDAMIERLKELFSVEVEIGKPKIAYRETVRKKTVSEYKHKKQTGGHGQYGHVQIEIEPLERGAGFEFVDKIVGGVIPKNYIPAVEKGIQEAMKRGAQASYPVVDVRVTLFYGSYHDVDSSDMSFQIAGLHAFKNGMKDADPVILEPVMEVAVFAPDDRAGDVMGEITSRRGRPMGMEPAGKGISRVMAQVPLAEMLDFSSKLSSITSGRGYFTMKFSGYQEAPHDVQQKIIVERERELEAKG